MAPHTAMFKTIAPAGELEPPVASITTRDTYPITPPTKSAAQGA